MALLSGPVSTATSDCDVPDSGSSVHEFTLSCCTRLSMNIAPPLTSRPSSASDVIGAVTSRLASAGVFAAL